MQMAFFLALIIGIPLYVHEGEEIPIILSLVALGLDKGPAMTFLLCSVGTCIPTLMMAQKVIGKKPTIFYTSYWFVFAFFVHFYILIRIILNNKFSCLF